MGISVVHNTERNLAHSRMNKAELSRVRAMIHIQTIILVPELGEAELCLGAHDERRVRQVQVGVEVAVSVGELGLLDGRSIRRG